MERDDSARYELATQRLARVGRDSTTFHLTAGNRAQARGDVEAARGHYRAGLAFHPTWETALVLSQLERREGDLEASLRALETAHRVAPENARVLYHYGATLLRTGELERARVLLREAVSRDPDDADYRRALELAERLIRELPRVPEPLSLERKSPMGTAASGMIYRVPRAPRAIDRWATVSLSGASITVTKSYGPRTAHWPQDLAAEVADLLVDLVKPLGLLVQRAFTLAGQPAE